MWNYFLIFLFEFIHFYVYVWIVNSFVYTNFLNLSFLFHTRSLFQVTFLVERKNFVFFHLVFSQNILSWSTGKSTEPLCKRKMKKKVFTSIFWSFHYARAFLEILKKRVFIYETVQIINVYLYIGNISCIWLVFYHFLSLSNK